jgi:hypothetical protein
LARFPNHPWFPAVANGYAIFGALAALFGGRFLGESTP